MWKASDEMERLGWIGPNAHHVVVQVDTLRPDRPRV